MSIFDLFTQMHLDGSADMVANHEKLIREMAANMGLDPDQAWAEAQIPRVEMTCPACGQPSTMTLLCRGCGGGAFAEYPGDEIAQARQHILDLPVGSPEARQHAAGNAFNPSGCMVCPNCIEQTLTNDAICPLHWLISPHTGINHLAMAQAQDQAPQDELRRVIHLWTNTLASGQAAEWRTHLFSHAIPNAIQAWKRWQESFINQYRKEQE